MVCTEHSRIYNHLLFPRETYERRCGAVIVALLLTGAAYSIFVQIVKPMSRALHAHDY